MHTRTLQVSQEPNPTAVAGAGVYHIFKEHFNTTFTVHPALGFTLLLLDHTTPPSSLPLLAGASRMANGKIQETCHTSHVTRRTYEFMTRDPGRMLASNKQLKKLEFIQADGREETTRVYPLSTRGEDKWFERKDLSVKQLSKCKTISIYALINIDSVSSSNVRLSTGVWEAARARHKGDCVGGSAG